eukprot:gene5834-37464_t
MPTTFYCIVKGHNPGIFIAPDSTNESWEKVLPHVTGFSGAKVCKQKSMPEAEALMRQKGFDKWEVYPIGQYPPAPGSSGGASPHPRPESPLATDGRDSTSPGAPMNIGGQGGAYVKLSEVLANLPANAEARFARPSIIGETHPRSAPYPARLYQQRGPAKTRKTKDGDAWDDAETRIDPADNKRYTRAEFIELYGGDEEWRKASRSSW